MLRFLRSGKVKDLYDAGDGRILVVFTDRLSAFDVLLADEVPHKGEVLCRLSAHGFSNCMERCIATHMLDIPDPEKMLVRKLDVVPVEVIGRNYVYGSYWKRHREGLVKLPKGTEPILAAKLTEPVIEFTTKFELKDRPVEEREILDKGWLTVEELDHVKRVALIINELMLKDCERAGFILADFKLEFGKDVENRIYLIDEVETPDTCRFWDAYQYRLGRHQESFDKQVVRDYLERVHGWDKAQPKPGTKLTQRLLPDEVIKETSERYIQAFERLTSRAF